MADNQRIQHIDAWRFIAVNLVLLSHIFLYSNLSFLSERFPNLHRLLHFGSFGVFIFFFISGFVICRGLIHEQIKTSTISLLAFYTRRAFRIMPPLWLFLGVLVILAEIGTIPIRSPQIIKSLLFLCNLPFSGGCSWYAAHTWSLAYEEQFYVLFPLLFVLIGLILRPRIALLILISTIGISIALRLWVGGALKVAEYLMCFSLLLTGCTAALYENQLGGFFHRLSPLYWFGISGFLIASVGWIDEPFYISAITYPLGIGLVVLGTPVQVPLIRVFFHHPTIGYLGKISYTVYLWQQLATAKWIGLTPWITLLLVVGVWLLAHLSWQYMEQPFIRIASNWSDAIKRKNNAKTMVRSLG